MLKCKIKNILTELKGVYNILLEQDAMREKIKLTKEQIQAYGFRFIFLQHKYDKKIVVKWRHNIGKPWNIYFFTLPDDEDIKEFELKRIFMSEDKRTSREDCEKILQELK